MWETMPTPIQILNEMNREYLRKKYPDIPPEYLHCKPIKANSANELTKAVIIFIRLSGGQAERISVTGRIINTRKTYTDILGHRKQIGSVKYIPSAMTKGSADISATIHGKSIKIEIKWGKDRQSPAQAKYQAEIEKAGGIYIIVSTFDQFYEMYFATFLLWFVIRFELP